MPDIDGEDALERDVWCPVLLLPAGSTDGLSSARSARLMALMSAPVVMKCSPSRTFVKRKYLSRCGR
jgi:hypothetical protein